MKVRGQIVSKISDFKNSGTEPETQLDGKPITARDPEGDKFEFYIDQNVPFRIDKKLGTLFVAGRLDREEQATYEVTVIGKGQKTPNRNTNFDI